MPNVAGIAFLGFPLHGIGKPPNTERSEHLGHVAVPMLFVQGTRDRLADLALLRAIRAEVGDEIGLMIDANHAYDVATARRMALASGEIGVGWF